MNLLRSKNGGIIREPKKNRPKIMANQTEKHPLNVNGAFYNDLTCVDCGLCPEIAPTLFRRDDDGGYSYVYKQPETDEEKSVAKEAVECCPTESIGDDG